MSAFQTKQFKTIQRIWYAKLKEEGFEDAEDTESGNEFMKVWHSCYFQTKYRPDVFEAKEQYYRLAGYFLEHYAFQTALEKQIWELHMNGTSLRKIAPLVKTKVCRVHKIVQILREKMMERHESQDD